MTRALERGPLPRLLAARAEGPRAGAVAIRQKRYGIWQEVSWEQYAAHVRTLCLGLVQLGLDRADTVAVISGNRPMWLYAELAAQAAGAIPLGILVHSPPEHVHAILEHSAARFVVVEDQEQADKVLSIGAALPRLQRIVVADIGGLDDHQHPLVVSLEAVERLGRESEAREPARYQKLLEGGAPDDVALLLYTAAPTGMKAAMVSHRTLLAAAASVLQVDPVREADEVVSFLPLSWIGEQHMSVASALLAGATVNFPEEPETTRGDLREIGPHVVMAPPRFWEAMCSEYQAKIADAGRFKRLATRIAFALGERATLGDDSGARTAATPVLSALASLMAFRTMLDKFGLSRVRHAYAAGAPLDPDVFRFFRAIGVNLKRVYGHAESSGICAVPPDREVRVNTCGKPTPGVSVRVSDDGEILVASESVFLGYYKNPDATARALRQGWLCTGDAGSIDDHGHLVVARVRQELP